MMRIAGSLALLLVLSLSANAQDADRDANQKIIQNLREARQQAHAREAAQNDANLRRLAFQVSLATQDKSRLLLSSGVSANPKLGKILVTEGRGNSPFITLYPVSEIRSVRLAEAGMCEIEGAVRLSTGARTSQQNHCEAGIYLLVLKTAANGALTLSLLDAQADANGRIHWREALKFPAERADGPLSKVSVEFPGPNGVSPVHPAWQVKFELRSKDSPVRAYLNLDITML